MKAVELLKQWKPKKPKKQPDPWFFVWGWGTGETTELPSVSEGTEQKKTYSKEDLPNRIFLSKSFFMVLGETVNGWSYYQVRQFFNDTPIADALLFDIPKTMQCGWRFEPNSQFFPDYKGEGKELFVSNEHLYNPLKLRWWVINRLIEMNVLPSKTSNHAN